MSEVKIIQSKLEDMERRLAKLDALEAGGVENWDFYDESLSDWRAENEIEEHISGFIYALQDVMAEASVDEPAGRGAGHSIDYDEGAIKTLLRSMINKVREIDQ